MFLQKFSKFGPSQTGQKAFMLAQEREVAMNDIGKIIGWTIKLGLLLATMGQLPAAIHFLKNEVVQSQKTGLVSLGTFNRRLSEGPHPHFRTVKARQGL